MDGLGGDKWLVKLSKDGDILEISDRITRSKDRSSHPIAKLLKRTTCSRQWLVTLSENVNKPEISEKITRSEDGKKGTVIDENGNELRFKLLDGKIDTKSQAIITLKNPKNPEFPYSYIRFNPVRGKTPDPTRDGQIDIESTPADDSYKPERRPDPITGEEPLEPSREKEVVSATPGRTPAQTRIGRPMEPPREETFFSI